MNGNRITYSNNRQLITWTEGPDKDDPEGWILIQHRTKYVPLGHQRGKWDEVRIDITPKELEKIALEHLSYGTLYEIYKRKLLIETAAAARLEKEQSSEEEASKR